MLVTPAASYASSNSYGKSINANHATNLACKLPEALDDKSAWPSAGELTSAIFFGAPDLLATRSRQMLDDQAIRPNAK